MTNLFAQQLQALRARSLRAADLAEMSKIKLMQELPPIRSATANRSDKNAGYANSAVFPWRVGDEQAAIDLAEALQNKGFFVPAIRYPTVARGSARLRITVTAAHTEDQIQALCEAIAQLSA